MVHFNFPQVYNNKVFDVNSFVMNLTAVVYAKMFISRLSECRHHMKWYFHRMTDRWCEIPRVISNNG